MSRHETVIRLRNDSEARSLFGSHDETLRKIEETFEVTTVFRDGELRLSSESQGQLKKAENVIREFLKILREGGHIAPRDVDYALRNTEITGDLNRIFLDRVEVNSKRSHITPRSHGQKRYIDAIRDHDIVFGIGPAGTGKTYLAMAMAVNALKKNIVSRIILTRPAVEAGESLGYLPGDIYEKVNPYLRPLYDALYDMMEPHLISDHIEKGVIEVAPLAFMRGRTLNDSFIIMDEAQNSTREQMKMFLTRLGFDSKTVITGDITQSDLPRDKGSGLLHAKNILGDIEGIEFVVLRGADVVRHELVQQIIRRYKDEGEGGNGQ
jgi:phosphate starvation-inducible PhoH-like protein